MRKIISYLFFLFLLLTNTASAQTQGIQWMQIVGSPKSEWTNKILQAPGGGYLILGAKEAATTFYSDLWLMKVTKEGAVEWQKTYGGSKDEAARNGITTPDGGYLILGYTATWRNDGDVTGHHGLDPAVAADSTYEEPYDVWILKINATGNIEWKKTYGGSRSDDAFDIIRTPDNNYMIIGQTASRDGDLAGKRRSLVDQPGVTNTDLWLFKIDVTGNLLWQKCYGGNDYDIGSSIISVQNGYMISGTTASTDLDVTNNHGGFTDGWVINIDEAGQILWQKCYGGSGEEYISKIVPYGNGYLAGADTNSPDGDVTGYHPGEVNSFPARDVWLFKIDATGTLISQNTIGSDADNFLWDMILTPENKVIALGTDYIDVVAGIPMIITIDPAGNIDTRIFPSLDGGDFISIAPASDNGFYIAGQVYSLSNTWAGNHVYGYFDSWLVKYGDINTITGKIFLDNNSNNVQDAGEPVRNNILVISTKGNNISGSLTINGTYNNSIDTGTYITAPIFNNPYYTIQPASTTSTFTTYFNTTTANFALIPGPAKNDIIAHIISLSTPRPGFQSNYIVKAYNIGTTTFGTAIIKLVKDHRFTFVSSTPTAQSMVNDTLTWNFTNLKPFDTVNISLTLQLATPPTANGGDTVSNRILALPIAGDETAINNTDTLKELVRNSFDPNDKIENHGGVITQAQVSGGSSLVYTIRFQNTGSDTAYNVYLKDTLSAKLDWSTFEMIGSSHAYNLSIIDGDKLTWTFSNIKLPYSGINEPASHGYIAYTIKPKPSVVVGDTIHNTAGIYFDFNLPVATNNAQTIVFNFTGLPVNLVSFKAMLNGSAVDITWKTVAENNAKQFEVQRSTNGADFVTIGIIKAGNSPSGQSYSFKDGNPVKGYNYYRLKSVDIDGAFKYSSVAIVNVSDGADIISSIYPNPSNGQVILKLQGTIKGKMDLVVMDHLGQVILTKQYGTQNTRQLLTNLELSKLAKGSYILKISIGDKVYNHKLLVQ